MKTIRYYLQDILLPAAKWGRGAAILLLGLCMAACGSDDDDNGTTQPEQGEVEEPQTNDGLTPGNDARPTTWIAPDYSQYEHTMAVQVQLTGAIADYQSAADMMCATINDEVRAVTIYQETGGEPFFPLIIANNSTQETISLLYYCDKLHRIFTIKNWATFSQSVPPTGDSGIYRPQFTETE